MEETKQAVALGHEAEVFLSSNLGKRIKERAQREADAAKDALVQVEPDNKTRIIELQNIVVRFESFESWLHEIITIGDAAYEAYQMSEAVD